MVNRIGDRTRRRRAGRGGARGGRPPARRGLHACRYPHELSGGQRQRVVIAGALVMDPEVIVADEPVSMLDVSIRTELLRLMLDLRKERGLTYLFITHDLSLAWVIADRIAVMYLGQDHGDRPGRGGHPLAAQSVHARRSSRCRRRPTRRRRASGPGETILKGETPDAAHIPPGCRFHPRCPKAFDRCRTESPPLFDVGGGHASACWLAEPGIDAGGRGLPVVDAAT